MGHTHRKPKQTDCPLSSSSPRRLAIPSDFAASRAGNERRSATREPRPPPATRSIVGRGADPGPGCAAESEILAARHLRATRESTQLCGKGRVGAAAWPSSVGVAGRWPAGPVQDQREQTKQKKTSASKSTEERRAVHFEFCVVSLKHCFHINTINSIIGMSQVLDKLFFLI